MKKEIEELENKIRIWKSMSKFKDFSKEIAEAEARIEELKQQNENPKVDLDKTFTKVVEEADTIVKSFTEKHEEIKNDEIILDEYGKVVWDVCMNTESRYLSNKDINYAWYGLFNVNSKSKNENTPKEDGSTYGYAEAEEHRFIYENYIRNSIKLLEEMSDSKQRTILRNIKKLTKVSNGLVTIDKTDDGETVYKIHNKTSYNKETHQFNNYVLIPSDILKLLICATNSNTIKIYCVLLYKCNCKDWITISNEYFHKVLGITSRTTIKKCCDLLILMGLIERTTIVDTSQKDVNGKILTKEYNQYRLIPYSEFRKRYNDLCCNKRNLKK